MAASFPSDDGHIVEDPRAHASVPHQANRLRLVLRVRTLTANALVIATAVAASQIIWLSTFHADLPAGSQQLMTVLSAALAATWWCAVGVPRDGGFRRLIAGTVWVFGGAAVIGTLLDLEVVQAYLMIALPSGLLGLFAGQHLLHSATPADRRSRI